MTDCTGWIVRATAGHDKGTLQCVVGVDREHSLLLVADGKRRKIARPKRKKRGHVDMVCRDAYEHPAIRKLRSGLPVSDKELRRALGAFRDESDQGGK